MKSDICIETIISEYRSKKIKGVFCDLIPIREQDLELVVMLRNNDRNKYFLNQDYNVTLNDQKKWYAEYLTKKNDIYWGIWNKLAKMVGTIRIYDIGNEQCEEGSCIIDEQYSKEAPYLVEAKYLSTVFAFDKLHLTKMINENRIDNKMMNSISKQIGFKLEKIVEIRGVQFNYLTMQSKEFRREKLIKIIDYWKDR